MGFFQFLKGLLKKILEPAQKPSNIDGSGIERYLRLLEKLNQALSAVNLAKQQLHSQLLQLRCRAAEVYEEAKNTLAAGREDLARIALRRRQAILSEIETLDKQVLELEKEAGELQIVQQRLATRLEVYKTKQDVLTAYQTAAEVQITGDAFNDIVEDSSRLYQALELAEKNRVDMQARVDAISEFELIQNGIANGLSKKDIRLGEMTESSLGQIDPKIEKELEALKREKRPESE